MFEVGFTEILLICGIALLVLGPERLPKLAADLGRWAGRARAMARQLRTQLEQEVQYDPLKETPRPAPTIHTPTPAAAETAGKTPATAAAAPDPAAQDHLATDGQADKDPAPEVKRGAVAAAGEQDESKPA